MKIEDVLLQIKQKGFSITRPRKMILDILCNHKIPVTGPQLYTTVSDSMDESTLYRNLQFLEKIGVIACVKLDKRGVHYEIINNNHHHHHMHCDSCGKIECLDICSVGKIVEKLSKQTGYKNIRHHLEFSGICQDCQQCLTVKSNVKKAVLK